MNLEKKVYTTFEVAKICNANITSIKNWIEQGELRAFRTPGGHYRIERNVLDDFLNRHGMPNPFVSHEQRRLLLVYPSGELLTRVRSRFGDALEYESTSDALDAILKLGQWKPNAAVVDDSIEGIDAMSLVERLRDSEELQPIDLIIVHNKNDEFDQSIRDAGAKFTVHQRDGEDAIVEALRRAFL